MFRIRAPTEGESAVVSELILLSDCGLLPALFGAGVRELLGYLQTRPANLYSREHTLVIALGKERGASDAEVLGALVAGLGSTMRAENLSFARLLLGWYGLRFPARLLRLARASGALSGIGGSDFYVSNLALFPAARRQGLGRELLAGAEERGRRLGAVRLVLDVEEHNEEAVAFYHRTGFREERRLLVDLGRGDRYLFRRLAKGV